LLIHHHYVFSKTGTASTSQQVGYGSVPGWWYRHWRRKYRHHTFMCHKYHVRHTSKQCNLDRLKSGKGKPMNDLVDRDRELPTNKVTLNKITSNTASPYMIGILIQTRPAQHMSCSSGQVLHLWRAHSPPNPSLMRDQIGKVRRRSHPKD